MIRLSRANERRQLSAFYAALVDLIHSLPDEVLDEWTEWERTNPGRASTEWPGLERYSGYLDVPDVIARPSAPSRPQEGPPVPDGTRWAIWERDDFTCLRCGLRRNLTIDHIKPRIAGGGNEPENLQTLCRSCNSRKGARVDG